MAFPIQWGAPLRGVAQFSKLLQKTATNKLNEQERYWFELVQMNGEQAQQMIAALLTYSRLYSQKQPDREFYLEGLVQSVLKKLNPASVTISVDIADNIPSLMGCYEHWFILLEQLLQNAILYQPADSDHQPHIQISLSLKQDQLSLAVEDNGIGVTDSSLEDLTQPFKRLQLDKEFPGLGMGLTYCQRIAQLQDGHLVFTNSPSGGLIATFSITVSQD